MAFSRQLLSVYSPLASGFLSTCRRLQGTLAYVFHPNTETMEADLQMLQWTKSQQVDSPPNCLEELRNSLDLEVFQNLITKNIIVARCFETQEPYPPPTYSLGLLQNITKTILLQAHRFPQLHNLHIAFNPHIAATWKHGENAMAVRGRPGTFLTSKERLSQFYDRDMIEQTREHKFELLEAPLSPYIDLKQYSIKNEYSSGFTKQRSFPYFHTLFVINNKGTPEVQLVQRGIMYTFGRLLLQAVERHGTEIIGMELPEPECAQCIVTTGKRFSFIWFQLNTLDMADVNDGGIKNLVHIERPGFLYSQIDPYKGQRKKVIADLNHDILRTLLSVYLLS